MLSRPARHRDARRMLLERSIPISAHVIRISECHPLPDRSSRARTLFAKSTVLYKHITSYSTVYHASFTPKDHDDAVFAMLSPPGLNDQHLRGLMSGIKRRARARGVIAFVRAITTTRQLMRTLFVPRDLPNYRKNL